MLEVGFTPPEGNPDGVQAGGAARQVSPAVLVTLFKLPHPLLLGGGIAVKVGDEVVGALGAGRRSPTTPAPRAGLDKIKDQLK